MTFAQSQYNRGGLGGLDCPPASILAGHFTLKLAAVATLVKAEMTNESDNRLPLVSSTNLVAAAFAFICKVEKERLSPTTPASGMKALAQIGAWHNSLDRMPAVILVSPLLNYFFF